MIVDLAIGLAHTVFWFGVIMLVVFALMRIVKWLEK